MPYGIEKHKSGYAVVNKATGKVHARHTTRGKAHAQEKLLRAVEHGWKPGKERRDRDDKK